LKEVHNRMPTYETLIDGKPMRIELIKTSENVFTAKTDGKIHTVQLPSDKPNLEKGFALKIGNKTYRIELAKKEPDKPFSIKVEEVTFKAEVKTPMAKASVTVFAPTTTATTVRKGITKNQAVEGAVTAPMTGKIMSVKVKKGDPVKQGQALCVIEAMKMENEIVAPKAGTVQDVNVSEGSAVNEGDALFIIA